MKKISKKADVSTNLNFSGNQAVTLKSKSLKAPSSPKKVLSQSARKANKVMSRRFDKLTTSRSKTTKTIPEATPACSIGAGSTDPSTRTVLVPTENTLINKAIQGPALEVVDERNSSGLISKARPWGVRFARGKLVKKAMEITSPKVMREAVAVMLMVMLAGGQLFGIFGMPRTADAATYTFTQSSWAGGATVTGASHSGNQTGWTEYSAKDATTTIANAGEDVQINSTVSAVTQTSTADFDAAVTKTNVTVASNAVTLESNIVAITAGTDYPGGFAIGLKSDGTVWSWGRNQYGALGTGAQLDKTFPVSATQVTALTNVIAISGGGLMAMALKGDGTVWTWGHGASGKLGNNATSDSLTPVQVRGVNNVGYLTGITAIDAGGYTTTGSNYAIRGSDGAVFAWGYNGNGQLGNNTTTATSTPVQVLGGAQGGTYLTGITSISAGFEHVLALADDGTVYAWGYGGYLSGGGPLGDGTYTERRTPVHVVGTSGTGTLSGITAVSANGRNQANLSLALGSNGVVYSWGFNGNGQIGNGTSGGYGPVYPVALAGLSGITAISAGDPFALALKGSDGSVYAWGYNPNGQLGNNSVTQSTSPVQVHGVGDSGYLTGITAISAESLATSGGYSFALALKNDGTVYTWGANTSGQLGIGNTTESRVPIQVHGPNDVGVLNLGASYQTSGSFLSSVIDMSQISAPSTVTYTADTPSGTSIAVKVRAGDDGVSWGSWVTGLSSGGSIAALVGHRYLQYQVDFTSDGLATPTLSDITINFSNYTNTYLVTLTSSKYDTTSTGNLISKLTWVGTATSSTEQIKLQVRSASTANGLDSAPWCGYADTGTCTGSNYFDYTKSGVAIGSDNALRVGGDDQFLQYKVTLLSGGTATPSLSSVTVQYVVNASPEFDVTYGSAGTGASSTAVAIESNDWGKVVISYKIRDVDTTSGTTNAGYITPSFEYSLNGGSSYADVTSGYLGASDLTNKVVEETNYNTYTATWNAKGQLGASIYETDAKIRVKINDNEAALNTATAVGPNFTLDTKSPVTSSFLLDGSSATTRLSITTTDDSQIQDYKISNNTDVSDDGNGLSAAWQTATSTTFSITRDWTLASTSSVTAVFRDIYGNVATSTAVAPATPSLMELKDISSPANDTYREFLAWSLYPLSASGATFASYELVRSSDGGATYGSPISIGTRTTNYYNDTTVASTTTYYYKVRVIDSDGDKSAYSPIVNDQPNGQGGTDTIAPTLSNVVSDTVKNNSIRIGWDTDEIATSRVEYGTVAGAYGSSAVSAAYVVTGHEVYLTGLTPNTTYYYRVKSTDVSSNIGTNDNSGAGYSFTTAGGPLISNVTVPSISDSGATIFWNTTTPSTSYVDWSTSNTLASYTESGSASLATSTNPVQHQVTLTGLTAGTTYYYQVKSTDADSNTSIDTNNGAFYSFVTTYDTKAPIISSVSSPVQAANSAVIVWTTDELATTQVEYGTTASTTDGGYSATTVVVSTPSIFHVSTLSPETSKTGGGTNELNNETVYYYRVISNDVAGNRAYSDESSLTTTKDGAVVVSISGGGGGGATPVAVDSTPPTITNVKVDNITAFGAKVTFITDEDTMGTVMLGDTTNYGYNISDLNWSTSHSIMLKNLQMNTAYHVKASATDKAGNTAYSMDYSFNTTSLAEDLGNLSELSNTTAEELQSKIDDLIESALPSLNPPFINTPEVSDVTEDSATVTWRTNVKSYGSVALASDQDYSDGKYTTETVEEGSAKNVLHSVTFANLKSNTKYHYSVKSYVFKQATAKSDDLTFVTQAAKVQAQIQQKKKDSFHVTWTTDEPSSSIVEYRKEGSSYFNKVTDDTLGTYHDILIENLTPGTTYEVKAYGLTKDGNLVESKENLSVTTSVDVVPPKIDSFKVDSALVPGRSDRTQTIVSWKTDEPANSTVFYEEGSGSPDEALANKQEDKSTFTDNHVIILTTLKPGSIYRFQISSTDDAGNTTTLPIRTVVTPKESQSIVDVIFKNFSDTFNFLKTNQ